MPLRLADIAGLAHRTRPALSSSSRSIHSACSQQRTTLGNKQAKTRPSSEGSGHSSSTLALSGSNPVHCKVKELQTTAGLHREFVFCDITATTKSPPQVAQVQWDGMLCLQLLGNDSVKSFPL